MARGDGAFFVQPNDEVGSGSGGDVVRAVGARALPYNGVCVGDAQLTVDGSNSLPAEPVYDGGPEACDGAARASSV